MSEASGAALGVLMATVTVAELADKTARTAIDLEIS
jgi:hypothetical protein